MRINIKVTLDDSVISDILSAAFEGGINYWCVGVKIHESGDAPKMSYASDVVEHGGTLKIHELDGDVHELTRKKMEDGIGKFMIHQRSFTDACEIDAADADLIVQYAIFGEIIYG
jgi:hypothetical protein